METTKSKWKSLNRRMSKKKIFISDPGDEIDSIEQTLHFYSERPYISQWEKTIRSCFRKKFVD